MVCGFNEHKVKDFLRARSFTAPQTGGIASLVQKESKDNKSVASSNAPRTVTQPIGRQESCSPARAYAMKVVEDKDATFDGSTDPCDHMLHYNQVMILNFVNNRLLCKVFLTSLRGPVDQFSDTATKD